MTGFKSAIVLPLILASQFALTFAASAQTSIPLDAYYVAIAQHTHLEPQDLKSILSEARSPELRMLTLEDAAFTKILQYENSFRAKHDVYLTDQGIANIVTSWLR